MRTRVRRAYSLTMGQSVIRELLWSFADMFFFVKNSLGRLCQLLGETLCSFSAEGDVSRGTGRRDPCQVALVGARGSVEGGLGKIGLIRDHKEHAIRGPPSEWTSGSSLCTMIS